MKNTLTRVLLAIGMAALLCAPEAMAGGKSKAYSSSSYSSSTGTSSSKSSSPSKSTYTSSTSSGTHRSSYAVGVARDSNGRIARSESAKKEFMKETGYSKGRPGYVVDHVVPLKRGGADSPSNMQWQTKAEAKAKDKWE